MNETEGAVRLRGCAELAHESAAGWTGRCHSSNGGAEAPSCIREASTIQDANSGTIPSMAALDFWWLGSQGLPKTVCALWYLGVEAVRRGVPALYAEMLGLRLLRCSRRSGAGRSGAGRSDAGRSGDGRSGDGLSGSGAGGSMLGSSSAARNSISDYER